MHHRLRISSHSPMLGKIKGLETRLAAHNWDDTVKRAMEAEIAKVLLKHSPSTRIQAAQKVLASKEGWYKQTPEGQYLEFVIRGDKL